jgi:hypothetical protein
VPPVPIPVVGAGVVNVFPASSATVTAGAVTVPLVNPSTPTSLKALLETATLTGVTTGALTITLPLPAGLVVTTILSATVFVGNTQLAISSVVLNTSTSIVITGTLASAPSTNAVISVLYV